MLPHFVINYENEVCYYDITTAWKQRFLRSLNVFFGCFCLESYVFKVETETKKNHEMIWPVNGAILRSVQCNCVT